MNNTKSLSMTLRESSPMDRMRLIRWEATQPMTTESIRETVVMQGHAFRSLFSS